VKTYTAEELALIIARHKKWLNGEDDGEHANLSYADLSSANLRSANLRYANLSYADLSYANLSSADLSYADLSYADLSSANLRSANLRYANLRSANLSYADLSYANLSSADLSYANLSSANLRYANLSSANGREINTFVFVGGIGSDKRMTSYWAEEDKVWCGCFTGALAEFEAKCAETHGDTQFGNEYKAAIAFFKAVTPEGVKHGTN
jgi:uncharacterized protein YjbI with pentapeptide repeats